MAAMQFQDWEEPIEISDKAWKQEKKSSRKKTVIIAVAAVVLIVIAVIASVLIYQYKNKADTRGFFNGIAWGTSCEKVEKKTGIEALSENGTKMIVAIEEKYEGKKGVRATIIYYFESEQLNMVLVNLYNGSDSVYTDETLLKEYTEQFDEWYGEHEEYTILDMDTYRWTTEESTISLENIGGGFLILSYGERKE